MAKRDFINYITGEHIKKKAGAGLQLVCDLCGEEVTQVLIRECSGFQINITPSKNFHDAIIDWLIGENLLYYDANKIVKDTSVSIDVARKLQREARKIKSERKQEKLFGTNQEPD